MKKLLIVVILVLTWIFLTFLYIYQNKALTLITKQPLSTHFISKPNGEFLQGQKIIVTFTASENYLGQVGIRFYNFNRINSDSVTFRIKEVGATNWYYEHTYTTDQFQPDEYFPFGFAVINDSKNKQYIVEVESVNGHPEDAITLSSVTPQLTTSYQYPRQVILTNPHTLMNFILIKTGGVGNLRDLLLPVMIYANFILLSLFLVYLFLDYLFNHQKIRFTSAVIIVIGLLILALSAVILYVRKVDLSMDITIAAFFILVIGVIVAMIEVKAKKHVK